MAFDADIDDNGRVTDPHVRHHVTAPRPLPTLDNTGKHRRVRKKYG
jgi:hypothetical protein